MDKETILALASTIYFRAKWSGEFSEANTVPDTFHADSGDMTCDFMHSGSSGQVYHIQFFCNCQLIKHGI